MSEDSLSEDSFSEDSLSEDSLSEDSVPGDSKSEGRVLVVDDSEIVLEVARMNLEDAGFSVVTVDNAFQMSAAIRDCRPDVILLDVKMPALSGDRAASILQRYSFSRDIPVVLHSDMSDAELAAIAEETGAAGFVRKSMDPEAMIEAIRYWVHRRGGGAGS